MSLFDTDVLIAGAGPVGLTLGIDLARRGVDVMVVEMRGANEPPSGQSNVVSARSMEAFRRLGIAAAVRGAGLPGDYPNDVAIRTTATGIELGRIRIPCRNERYTAKEGPDTWWPTPEPPHRINHAYLHPILVDAATATPGSRICNGSRVRDFAEHDDRVVCTVEDPNGGNVRQIAARYLVGCDGAHSTTRAAIGANLVGDAAIVQAQTTYIRAPGLLGLMADRAWAIDCVSPRSRGLVFAIDGIERWVVHTFAQVGASFPADRRQGIREILGVSSSFKLEILSQEDWTGRRMIADRFRSGRVFLCGDAAHIWAPFAAYGMNAGIADAMNLSWLLAAVIEGWGNLALLDAYEIERRPITDQVSRHAMRIASEWIQRYGEIPDRVDSTSAELRALRERIGRQVRDGGGYCCGGLNFGYFYDNSPIIAYDGEAPPAYTLCGFTQSTVPGCRTPHLWLRDGTSLYDLLGDGFTLLRFDPQLDVTALSNAAADRLVPLKVADIDEPEVASFYDCKLLLSRPDVHVAWRGDKLPSDSLALIDRIRGAAIGE